MSRPVITSVRVTTSEGAHGVRVARVWPFRHGSALDCGSLFVLASEAQAVAELLVPSPCVESFGPNGEYSRSVPFPEGTVADGTPQGCELAAKEKQTIDTTKLDTSLV